MLDGYLYVIVISNTTGCPLSKLRNLSSGRRILKIKNYNTVEVPCYCKYSNLLVGWSKSICRRLKADYPVACYYLTCNQKIFRDFWHILFALDLLISVLKNSVGATVIIDNKRVSVNSILQGTSFDPWVNAIAHTNMCYQTSHIFGE